MNYNLQKIFLILILVVISSKIVLAEDECNPNQERITLIGKGEFSISWPTAKECKARSPSLSTLADWCKYRAQNSIIEQAKYACKGIGATLVGHMKLTEDYSKVFCQNAQRYDEAITYREQTYEQFACCEKPKPDACTPDETNPG